MTPHDPSRTNEHAPSAALPTADATDDFTPSLSPATPPSHGAEPAVVSVPGYDIEKSSAAAAWASFTGHNIWR